MKACLRCGKLTHGATYHPTCNPKNAYKTNEYRAARADLMASWLQTYGALCAGDKRFDHEPHYTSDLTVDHVDNDNTNHDPANLRVICRSLNSQKAARRRG